MRYLSRLLNNGSGLTPMLLIGLSALPSIAEPLPPVPFPVENQFSQEKADLGKILFWDEQLSSDNTMSCGTCHQAAAGGTDARRGVNPGADGLFGTADDAIGSPGVLTQDVNDDYVKSDLYDMSRQATGRQAPPSVMAMYAPEIFWDGRAGSAFSDPVTGELLIASGGALENQAAGPPTSDAEMAHAGRDWSMIIEKIAGARPLALASNLTPDMDAVIALGMTYPELFEQAFGDDEVTAGRIAMAIATYERTLVPDQTPYDLFVAGDSNAMTANQINGLTAFRNSLCAVCHGEPQFTDNLFRNIGVRPIAEDAGRYNVTNVVSDRGRFKVPSLRNTGLKDRFMHHGGHETIEQVFDFYAHRNGEIPFPQNLDPFMISPIAFPAMMEARMTDFIMNGLTDPRVANETFPFDRPVLYADSPNANPMVSGSGTAGSSGFVPEMVAVIPPNLGNDGFKVGINMALGGAQAWVSISNSAPVGGIVAQDTVLGPVTLDGVGDGEGYGTMHWPIPNDPSMDGQNWYMQWVIADPNAAGGFAYSPVAELTTFCTMAGGCVNTCPADISFDGSLDFFDVSAFLNAFVNGDPVADFNDDGALDFFDVSEFLNAFNAGCP